MCLKHIIISVDNFIPIYKHYNDLTIKIFISIHKKIY